MASGPITSWEIDGKTVETVSDFSLGRAPKSLQMEIAAMKLKSVNCRSTRLKMKYTAVDKPDISHHFLKANMSLSQH